MELRCRNKMFGVTEGHTIEIKCNSSFCGAGAGWTVLHRFDLNTSEMIDTRRYKDPARRRTQ